MQYSGFAPFPIISLSDPRVCREKVGMKTNPRLHMVDEAINQSINQLSKHATLGFVTIEVKRDVLLMFRFFYHKHQYLAK
jgi:hypothetical protein